MPHKHLTAQFVERAKPPAAGQVDLFDRGYPGLALRLSYGGTKSWIYFHRVGGKQKRLGLGTYPDTKLAEARDAWRAAREALKVGRDPAAVPAVVKRNHTFSAILADWLTHDQGDKRTRNEVEKAIKRETKPGTTGRSAASPAPISAPCWTTSESPDARRPWRIHPSSRRETGAYPL